MTLAQLIQRVVGRARVQLLHECVLGARAVKARKTRRPYEGHDAHTRVEFATAPDNFSPNDLFKLANGGKPANVGIILWVSIDEYERLVSQEEDIIDYRIKVDDGPAMDAFNDTLSLDALQRLADMFQKDTGHELTTLKMNHATRRKYLACIIEHDTSERIVTAVKIEVERDMMDLTIEARHE